MTKACIFTCLLILLGTATISYAQNNNTQLPSSINEDGSPPHNSAILDIQSQSKGVLMPRMSHAQIRNIPNPVEGLMAYDNDFHCLRIYQDDKWECLCQDAPMGLAINANSIGGSMTDYGTSITADAFGNVYITGFYEGTITLEGYSMTATGNTNAFMAKYNSGNLQWIKNIGGLEYEKGLDIITDISGNIYLSGHFNNSINFEGTSLTSNGGHDIFLAKYDINGNLLWAQHDGGNLSEYAKGISLDTNGNIYLIGSFSGTANFSNTTVTSAGAEDIFVLKYNSTGNLIWVQTAGGTGNDYGHSLAVDSDGNILMTGLVEGTGSFGNISYNVLGAQDAFIAKCNNNGSFLFAKVIGGAGNDYSSKIIIDNQDNFYITGRFEETAYFDVGDSLVSEGAEDIFIAKYNSNNSIEWLNRAGGTGYDRGKSISLDSDGNIYLTGTFQGLANFENTSLTGLGGGDIFTAKYNGLGTLLWIEKGGGINPDYAEDIAIDKSGLIYVLGNNFGSASFGNINIGNLGSLDIFILQYGE